MINQGPEQAARQRAESLDRAIGISLEVHTSTSDWRQRPRIHGHTGRRESNFHPDDHPLSQMPTFRSHRNNSTHQVDQDIFEGR